MDEAATASGLSRKRIRGIEAGAIPDPFFGDVVALAHAYGTSVADLERAQREDDEQAPVRRVRTGRVGRQTRGLVSCLLASRPRFQSRRRNGPDGIAAAEASGTEVRLAGRHIHRDLPNSQPSPGQPAYERPRAEEKSVADRVRIECINKSQRTSPHERISHVGGRNPNGTAWKLPEADAIAGIESGRWAFYVERPAGHAVNVIVAERLGRKYLKTAADGEQPDNLLALPECP